MCIENYVTKFTTDEINLTKYLQDSSWVNSFASELLTDNVKKCVNGLKKGRFEDYSGVQTDELTNYLGKFFYIARYVDNELKEKYMSTIDKDSPLANSKFKPFDSKPWEKHTWKEIPEYIKKHIYIYRVNIFKELGITINNKLSEEKFLNALGDLFDKEKIKKTKLFKTKLFKINALQHTTNALVQNQIGNIPYIQGYLMNVLNFASGYYKGATDNGFCLLSGPSGTAYRVMKYAQEWNAKSEKYEDLELRLRVASLCLASLGYPYNCHSYYEIISVVFPERVDWIGKDGIKKFEVQLKESGLLQKKGV